MPDVTIRCYNSADNVTFSLLNVCDTSQYPWVDRDYYLLGGVQHISNDLVRDPEKMWEHQPVRQKEISRPGS